MNKSIPDTLHFLLGLLLCFLATTNVLAQDKHIAAGFMHSLFVDSEGQVWAWGNTNLQSQNNERIPYRTMQNARSVFASRDHRSFVIQQDGSLWGWGETRYGQLGDIRTSSSKNGLFITAPRKIMESVTDVAGTNAIFAIKPDNTLWAWGEGTIERGDISDKTLTRPVKILDDVTHLSSIFAHTVALKKDGTLWAWGENQCGALGTGDRVEHITPVKVNMTSLGKRKVVQIAVRFGETYLVADDGTVWYCGEYNIRQDGCIDPPKLVPTRLDTIDNVASIALGRAHELYLKKDGSVWASGLGSPSASTSMWALHGPGKVMDDAKEIAAGFMHSIVLKKDGTVWTWGDNSSGQLGDGTNQSSATPVQVRFPDDHTDQDKTDTQTVSIPAYPVAVKTGSLAVPSPSHPSFIQMAQQAKKP